jgi:nicotinate-nucleotide adenylyltransferase
MFTMPQPNDGNLWAGRTVGLLGGSFNPAHEGHRHVTLYALKMLGLDAVWWMVSPQNPLKSTKDMAPVATRLANARAAADHPRIIATDIETKMGTQYTTDTLAKLRQLFPRTNFVWLMGMDNLRQVHRWRDWQDIFHTIPVCVLDRPPRHNSVRTCPAMERFRTYLVPQQSAKNITRNALPSWTVLHIPLNSLSATEIRARNLQKQPKKGKVKA